MAVGFGGRVSSILAPFDKPGNRTENAKAQQAAKRAKEILVQNTLCRAR
jgi:hypothetical protein